MTDISHYEKLAREETDEYVTIVICSGKYGHWSQLVKYGKVIWEQVSSVESREDALGFAERALEKIITTMAVEMMETNELEESIHQEKWKDE